MEKFARWASRLIFAGYPNIFENHFDPPRCPRQQEALQRIGQNNFHNRSNGQTSILIWQGQRASPCGSLRASTKTLPLPFSPWIPIFFPVSAILPRCITRPLAGKHRVIDLPSIRPTFNCFTLRRLRVPSRVHENAVDANYMIQNLRENYELIWRASENDRSL